MKYIILLIFLICSTCLYSQEFKDINLNSSSDSIISILNAEIEIGLINQEKSEKLNSELKNQLIIYKAKEDYFAAALEDQSNRFALIVTVLIAFIGFISFSWYKIEKLRINKRFQSFDNEFEKIKEENIKLNSRLCTTSGNAYVLIADTMREKKSYVYSFQYSIFAARENFQSDENKTKKESGPIIANLRIALKEFAEIKKDPSLKEKILKMKESILEEIEIVQKGNNEEVKDLCAEIRIGIKKYLI